MKGFYSYLEHDKFLIWLTSWQPSKRLININGKSTEYLYKQHDNAELKSLELSI